VQMPPKPKIVPPLPPKKPIELPLGIIDGDRKATRMPKGTTLKNQHNTRIPNPGRPICRITDDGSIMLNDKDKGLFTGDFNNLNTGEISNITSTVGTPDGDGTGPAPIGFKNGTLGGRVYFIRMKQEHGAWNENDEGVRRLLNFLNGFFPCERESRAMTCAEMREHFLHKNSPPSFLYIYADDNFSLSSTDVTVLHQYVGMGGFLFIDSRPDPEIQTVVSREIDKVLPGIPMRSLSRNNAINSFLFRTSDPVVGENTITMQNYGIMKNGRLSVFYTMGNFSHLYASHVPNELPYFAAQYQMGANVMLYAIRKGDNSDIATHAGANAKITTEALRHLRMLEPTAGTPGADKSPLTIRPTVISPPVNSVNEQPDEVKVVE